MWCKKYIFRVIWNGTVNPIKENKIYDLLTVVAIYITIKRLLIINSIKEEEKMSKKEPKSCSVPYSHTSYHSSGQTNFDVIGKSGRLSINNVYGANDKTSKGKFESSDGKSIVVNTKKD